MAGPSFLRQPSRPGKSHVSDLPLPEVKQRHAEHGADARFVQLVLDGVGGLRPLLKHLPGFRQAALLAQADAPVVEYVGQDERVTRGPRRVRGGALERFGLRVAPALVKHHGQLQ